MGRAIEIIKKFPKFVLSGGLGTVVDTAVLWLLSHFVFRKYAGDYLIAPVISFDSGDFFGSIYITISLQAVSF